MFAGAIPGDVGPGAAMFGGDPMNPDILGEGEPMEPYTIHIPNTMIRGESYRGLIVSASPVSSDTVFLFGAGNGDIILPDSARILVGTNHALFDITPIDSTILSGRITSGITVIQPDGQIIDVPVETHPGVGTVSRLWLVGPGADGVLCDGPQDTSASAVAARAADGVFDVPDPEKSINTRMSTTTIHVFLSDRYCTPVTAPPGGVSFTLSSNTPELTFGASRTHLTGIIPQGFNTAVVDVNVNGEGIIYATGNGVSPDAIGIRSKPVEVELHMGIGPSLAMESSYVKWYLWLERNGERFVPSEPYQVYLTTNNPVLANFELGRVDSSGPAFTDIRPHQAYMIDGFASGVIYTGTPAGVGDVRLLAGNRNIEVHAHVPGIGAATAEFQVGMPGAVGGEFTIQSDQLRECMEEESSLPDGFYSRACNDMWQRLLVASHFYDIKDATGAPLDSVDDTVSFLNDLLGGDNAESGEALYDLVSSLDEYTLLDGATGGLSSDLSDLLGDYLQTSDINLEPSKDLGITAEMLDRMPTDPPPNKLTVESFPGRPGIEHVVISTWFEDGSFVFPVYIPDGTITLSSDWGLDHPPEVKTYGSNPRPHAVGTRASSIDIPVSVNAPGTLTASLGGVGGQSISIDHLASEGGRQLHVSTLPGSGQRDLVAIVSILDSEGLVIRHDGEVFVDGGQGASDVEIVGWRGGGGMVRGNVDGVGEIIIHAPGLGGGTALTTPVRHETGLDVWHPDMVHVSEEFPLTAHTLDTDGLPIRMVDVAVSGDVRSSGAGLELKSPGTTPIIIQHDGMFHTGYVDGFLNPTDINIRMHSPDVVELNDTISLSVSTGVMQDPIVDVYAPGLLFSGEQHEWASIADRAGEHTVSISVTEPGWEPFSESVGLKVSRMLDVSFDAVTPTGVGVDAAISLCGNHIISGIPYRMEPNVCEVSPPPETIMDGVDYALNSLSVDGAAIQPGSAYNFDADTSITALYRGVVTIEVVTLMPDGTSTEILYGKYEPGDLVFVPLEPSYEWWGLIWDRPAKWNGLPLDARIYDESVEWTAAGDAIVTIEYERDITYLVALGAAGLSIPVIIMMRKRIPILRQFR